MLAYIYIYSSCSFTPFPAFRVVFPENLLEELPGQGQQGLQQLLELRRLGQAHAEVVALAAGGQDLMGQDQARNWTASFSPWFHLATGQNPVPPVNIPIPTKIGLKWVVHLPQNGTIGFDPQPR